MAPIQFQVYNDCLTNFEFGDELPISPASIEQPSFRWVDGGSIRHTRQELLQQPKPPKLSPIGETARTTWRSRHPRRLSMNLGLILTFFHQLPYAKWCKMNLLVDPQIHIMSWISLYLFLLAETACKNILLYIIYGAIVGNILPSWPVAFQAVALIKLLWLLVEEQLLLPLHPSLTGTYIQIQLGIHTHIYIYIQYIVYTSIYGTPWKVYSTILALFLSLGVSSRHVETWILD